MFEGGTKPGLISRPDDQGPAEAKVAAIDKKSSGRGVKELAACIEKELDEVHRELDAIEELIVKADRDQAS